MTDLSIIAIGRNEGDRLKACLRSLPTNATCIYVDSGSTDGSVAFAEARGVAVVNLSTEQHFTAARARNAGLSLTKLTQSESFVQMIDGDCVLDPGWLAQAITTMHDDPTLAVVFGRTRERYPERSIYNHLCDIEWNVPIGEARSCGGNALFRLAPIVAAQGYDQTLIAGEEPDLCLRLRSAGWRIWRIDAEMVLHDAAITRFSQWWRRTERSGHAFAELYTRHGSRGDAQWRRESLSAAFWGLLLPISILTIFIVDPLAAMVLAFAFPTQIARISLRKWRDGFSVKLAGAQGFFLVIGKFAQAKGLLRYYIGRLTGQRSTLIEYKDASSSSNQELPSPAHQK